MDIDNPTLTLTRLLSALLLSTLFLRLSRDSPSALLVALLSLPASSQLSFRQFEENHPSSSISIPHHQWHCRLSLQKTPLPSIQPARPHPPNSPIRPSTPPIDLESPYHHRIDSVNSHAAESPPLHPGTVGPWRHISRTREPSWPTKRPRHKPQIGLDQDDCEPVLLRPGPHFPHLTDPDGPDGPDDPITHEASRTLRLQVPISLPDRSPYPQSAQLGLDSEHVLLLRALSWRPTDQPMPWPGLCHRPTSRLLLTVLVPVCLAPLTVWILRALNLTIILAITALRYTAQQVVCQPCSPRSGSSSPVHTPLSLAR